MTETWQGIFRGWLVVEGPGDPAHGLAHVERVVVNAARLGEAENADPDILLPAAWLHDCVQVPKDSPDRSRASLLAADRAVEFLRKNSYPVRHHEAIHHAIVAHSFSAKVKPLTTEARVLQDADRLDAIGAIGLSRCLMLGGHMGKPLASPEDPFCREREPDDNRFVIDHFYAKLLTLAGSMQTEAGRGMADQRTKFLRNFLEQLAFELEA